MKRYWIWPIAFYLFLGGLGGGMLTFAAILDVIMVPDATLAPILLFGVLVAVLALGVGTGLLIFELGQPKVFYRAFVTKTAIIKWGAVMLTVAMVFAVLYITCYITWLSWLPWFESAAASKFFISVAGIIGAGVMVYTGVLLSTLKAKPFWNTPALPMLFTVSALSTGSALIAACVGVWPLPEGWLAWGAEAQEYALLGITPALLYHEVAESVVHWLHNVDAVLVIVEIVTLLLFVVLQRAAGNDTAKMHARRWLTGTWAPLFWAGMVGCGLLVPFLCYQAGGVLSEIIAPILVLSGGLLLRFMIVFSDERRAMPGEKRFYSRLPKGDEQFLKAMHHK